LVKGHQSANQSREDRRATSQEAYAWSGPPSRKKRQKERQRKEKQQEKMAKRLERKRQSSEAGSNAPDAAVPADQINASN
jgi:hypothetical protein